FVVDWKKDRECGVDLTLFRRCGFHLLEVGNPRSVVEFSRRLSSLCRVHRMRCSKSRAAGPVACDRRGSDPSSSGSVSPFHAGLTIEISIDKRPLAVVGFVCGRLQGYCLYLINFERYDIAV